MSRCFQIAQNKRPGVIAKTAAKAAMFIAGSAAFFGTHGFRLCQIGRRKMQRALHGLRLAPLWVTVKTEGRAA